MRSKLVQALAMASAVTMAAAAMAQPANDACASAQAIAGYATFDFNSVGATTDGLSNATCNLFGSNQIFNDVWFCWTAPASEAVLVETCGIASYDTKIAAYQGCGCPEGTMIVACDDDATGCANNTTRITFATTAGQSYLLRIGAFAASNTGAAAQVRIARFVPTTVVGPVVNPANNHTYYLLASANWTTSRGWAVALGGDLTTINDADENEWVRVNVLGSGGVDRRGWIGYNDEALEGTFVWSSGQASTYTNWNSGEPSNSGGIEDYTEMLGSNGRWNDQSNTPVGLSVFGIVEVNPAPPTCPADFNGVGGVTVQDIFDFLGAWFQNDARADFNGAGGITVQDVFDYLSAWFTGCP